jgi:hypothetical protein
VERNMKMAENVIEFVSHALQEAAQPMDAGLV